MSGDLNPGPRACVVSALPIQTPYLYFLMENSERTYPRLHIQNKDGCLSSPDNAPFHLLVLWHSAFYWSQHGSLSVVSHRTFLPGPNLLVPIHNLKPPCTSVLFLKTHSPSGPRGHRMRLPTGKLHIYKGSKI